MKKAFGTLAILALAGTANAQTISNGNAQYVFNAGHVPTTSTAIGGGSANLNTNNASNDQLFENWWWYRVDGVDTREYRYSTAAGTGSPGSAFAAAGDTATATFNFTNFRSELRYVIVDTDGAGTNEARLMMTNKITNTSAAARTINIFNYADYDPAGSFSHPYSYDAGQSALVATSGTVTCYHKGFGASAYQAAPYTTVSGTAVRGYVADTLINNLNNTVTGAPADYTGAFQWTFTLQPGEMYEILSVLSINTPPVPTPGAFALVGLAGLAGIRRRR
ncbi:MAG: PEP-CTERM sorting domain-containing protein [Phycisphaerae bacterium]|nr:PEP-CTERM sorting domain-containing protein [Phycisphaerae bacterium]